MTCAQCDELRAELAPHRLRKAYGLAPAESAIVLALHGCKDTVPAGRLATRCAITTGSLRVLVYDIRQKMGDGVVETQTPGYRLTPEGRERVAEVLG